MYTVTLDENLIHNPSAENESFLVMNGVISKKVNCADSFTFTIYPSNPSYGSIELLVSKIKVYKDGTCIFSGRPLSEETDFDNGKTVFCESDFAILNDTVMRPYEFSGSVSDYIRLLVNAHNEATSLDKQITVGSVTVTDPNNTIVRSTSDYVPIMEELIEKTVNNMGGYLRMIPGTMTLDYIQDSLDGTNQTLEIGKNILDFNRSISTEALATALIPLGKEDEETGERVTIKSVNGGSDYISDQTAETERGRIYTTMIWDDVSVPANLLTKARAALTDLKRLASRIEMSAVDLKEAGMDVDSLDFFEYVTVVDAVHNVSGQYLITERKYNLSAPEKDMVTFGGADNTISSQTSSARSAADRVGARIINTVTDIVERQTELIKGGAGGHVVIGTDPDGKPNEIFFMDTDSVETARQILRINMNGIGFSTSGIDGPYSNAWTIDGNLNASFINTGILTDGGADPNFTLDLTNGTLNIKQLTTVAANQTIYNLLPSVYYRENLAGDTYTYNGVTWTLHPDGTVIATGKASGGGSSYAFCGGVKTAAIPPVKLDPGKKYTVSGSLDDDHDGAFFHINARFYPAGVEPNGTNNGTNYVDKGYSVTVPEGYEYVMVYATVYNGTELPPGGVVFEPMLEVGDTKHAYQSTHNGSRALTSRIEQTAEEISLKVSETDVTGNYIIGKINLSSTTATIAASHVNLEGSVKISDLATATKDALITGTTVKNQYYLSTSTSSATGGSWSDTVSAWSSGKYVWTRVATTKTYAGGNSTTTHSTAVYDANLTTALSTGAAAQSTANGAVTATVSCYYRSKTHSAPSITTSTSIGTSDDTDNAWEYVMPTPKNGRYFYTCERYTKANGTVSFSTVREMSNLTYTSQWCSSTDSTRIDGANIYTGSISADKISVNDLQTLGATIGGWSITTTTIQNEVTVNSKVHQVGMYAPANPSSTGSNAAFYVYNKTDDDYPFLVRYNGSIRATAGTIAGWTITDDLIYKEFTDGDGVLHRSQMRSGSTYNKNYTAFSVRSSSDGGTNWDSQFNVTYGGKLTATAADITGKITATSGNIGGWGVTDKYIQKYSSYTEGTASNRVNWAGLYAPESPSSSNNAFAVAYASYNGSSFGTWTYPFRVTYNGDLYSTSAIITGGSINIATGSTTDDKIKLSYGDWTAAMMPLGYYAYNSSTSRRAVLQGGGIFFQTGATSITGGGTSMVSITATSDNAGQISVNRSDGSAVGKLFVTSGGGGVLYLYDTESRLRVNINDGGIYLYGTNTSTPFNTYGQHSIDFMPVSTSAGNGGWIDFHYNRSSSDYTSRLIGASNTTTALPSITSGSDRRMKEDVEYWAENTGATARYCDFVNQLRPVRYKYKKFDGTHFGFIAQDILETCNSLGIDSSGLIRETPIFSPEGDDTSYYTLTYTDLIAFIVNYIQKMQKEITDLKAIMNGGI